MYSGQFYKAIKLLKLCTKIRGVILLFDEYSKYSNIEAVKSFMRTSTFY